MAKRAKKKRKVPAAELRQPPEGREPLPAKPARVYGMIALQAAVIIAAMLWIYWPSMRGGWLWDDDLLVTDNVLLRHLGGLWKIWFQPGVTRDYYPFDSTVWWVEWHLWGMRTTGYHVTNVVLQIVSCLLVWRLLAKVGLKLAWLGGLLLAVHPLQVESVAWIAEMKNTLSLPFFLLAMIFWMNYEESNRRRDYLLALGLFLVAMLGKPTMLAFPGVILLYAWWKRGRIGWSDVKGSLPFWGVALLLGLATVWFTQISQPPATKEDLAAMGGFGPRVIVSGWVAPFVLGKVFLPLELMPVYPKWTVDSPSLLQLLPWPVLGGIIWYLWTKRKGWGKDALLGLGFFLAMLAPVIVFVAANHVTMTWSMDHMEYLSMIGMFGLIAGGLGVLYDRPPFSLRVLGAGALSIVMGWLAWKSHSYARNYSDQETLLSYTLRLNPEAWSAHYNLGLILMKTGREEQAVAQFEEALRLSPAFARAEDSLGNVLTQMGRSAEAIGHYENALEIKPDFAEAHYNFGELLGQTGRTEEAVNQYQEALKIKPELYKARYNLGNIWLRTGRAPEAIEQYQAALKIEPDYAEAHYNLGNALMQTSRAPEAIEQFAATVKLSPDNAEAHYSLGNALYLEGHAPEAIEQFQLALKLNPNLGQAHYNLGYILMQNGNFPAAREQFEQTLQLNPNDTEARNNLVKMQALEKPAPPNK